MPSTRLAFLSDLAAEFDGPGRCQAELDPIQDQVALDLVANPLAERPQVPFLALARIIDRRDTAVGAGGKAVPSVTAVRPELWDNTLTPALQRVRDRRRAAMKTILSALVALSVIASVAGPANAFDAKTFFEQVDRDHN